MSGRWRAGRGVLGPLRPLLGDWSSEAAGPDGASLMHCTRSFRPFGKGWIELDARWNMGEGKTYRELAFYGAMADGKLGFHSFTSDGKRSEGALADGSDVNEHAIAFEAQMPAGLARMIYWPAEEGGFYFAVESRTQKGWNRFLRHHYRAGAN